MPLEKLDLLKFEAHLAASLHPILQFKSHALYFPAEELSAAEWLADEAKLLLPLWFEGEFFGVFMAREPQLQPNPATTWTNNLELLPQVASLALANLLLHKNQGLDKNTGLCSSEALLQELEQAITQMQESFAQEFTGGSSGFGLISIRFRGLAQLVQHYGYIFGQDFQCKLAQALQDELEQEYFLAKSSDHDFAVLVPAGGRQAEALSVRIQAALSLVRQPDPFTGTLLGVQVQVGYALYPQDMDGSRKRGSLEQAASLLHYAKLTADLAKYQPLAYGRILFSGGQITEILPLARVRTDLNRQFGAKPGQRFCIWQGTDPETRSYRGELVLLEVGEYDSTAEVIQLGHPIATLHLSDNLELIPNAKLSADLQTLPQNSKLPTDLLDHGDFLASLAQAIDINTNFSLALVHLQVPEAENLDPEASLQALSQSCRQLFKEALGGRFGLYSLIFFHNQQDAQSLLPLYTKLSQDNPKLPLGIGLATWPCLEYQPADILECTQKALEYALLLPFPHVGAFDSLALNISADKLHCKGDMFGAIAEYKQALLLDENNALAWNSLGICLASLNKLPESRHHFNKALELSPHDAALTYNLATVCQSLSDRKAALHYYNLCLELNPKHLYALTRLGQLHEQAGQQDQAQACFNSAATLHPQAALPHRHLASLALRQNQPHLAREHLHQALQRNPRDAMSLTILARLYLNSGEDPQLAKLLARQALSTQPDLRPAWLELARALEAQGQADLAKEARLQAI